MTDLEKQIVIALRLSETSAEALLENIQIEIDIARADIIRSGISNEKASDEDDVLVNNVIVKYVVSEMASIESERVRAFEAYKICLDELRKSIGYDE